MAQLATNWKQPFKAREYEPSKFTFPLFSWDVLEYNPDQIRSSIKETYFLRCRDNARRIYE